MEEFGRRRGEKGEERVPEGTVISFGFNDGQF